MTNALQPNATIGDLRRIGQLREIGLPQYVLMPGDP
jgi:hypothetical protein